MPHDKTEFQDQGEREQARELSKEPGKPPTQIDGYRITNFIGSGAYGEVWGGVDRNTGRRVAIKFYTRRSSTDVAQLAREVEKLVVLSADRYVVQLLDVGWHASPPYYVMDFIEHGSLEDRLTSQSIVPVNEAIEMFEEIATGLMHLHGKGVLHCDIKPGNILLDQDSKPRLADFGQSRLSTDDTAALGTLYYMAPEQADLDAPPDARWDVYALGAVLYTMLTGEPPYRDRQLSVELQGTGNLRKKLRTYRDAIRKAPKPNAHRRIAGVDRALAEIIDRCIAADPKKRFASVQSVLLALKQRQESIAMRPLLMLGLLGPFLLLGLMGLFGWYGYNRAIGETDAAVTHKAIESNRFAARLAARSASEQIDKYFRGVQHLARDVALQNAMDIAFDTENQLAELRNQLTDPNRNGDSTLDEVRNRFRNHPVRARLQTDLERRVTREDMPDAASWWIYDPWGVQAASWFKNRANSPTIGKNYSYRSYFTGLENDLINTTDDGESFFDVPPDIADRTTSDHYQVSAIFFSDATATWKIAFSAPVYKGDRFVGIVGLTVEMGSFIDFESGKPQQYAMMVDGREGKHEGIVLEHPRFTRWLNENKRLHASLTHCQVDMEKLLGSAGRFEDPVGDQDLGEDYRSERIAAFAPIAYTDIEAEIAQATRATNTSADTIDNDGKPEKPTRESGLYVIAVEDYAQIIGPSQQLGKQLLRLATIASILLLIVALGLWFLVLRSTRRSRQQFAKAFSPTGDSSRTGSTRISTTGSTGTGSRPDTGPTGTLRDSHPNREPQGQSPPGAGAGSSQSDPNRSNPNPAALESEETIALPPRTPPNDRT